MFFSRTKSILGLDIGSSHIKAAHLKQHKQNWKLINWAIVKTPEGAISDGRIVDKAKLVGTLKDILHDHNFKEKKVVTAVSNRRVVTRYITMPDMPERELLQAVKWEAQNHIPIYDKSMKIDFKILGKTDSNRSKLVIAGISKEIAQEYLDMLTDAGLKPIALDIYPISLERFFNISDSAEPVCIIDFGAFDTELVIIKDGHIYADSVINVGMKDIQDSIIMKNELDSCQEDFLLSNELLQTNMPLLNKLTGSINRFLQFFSTQNRGERVNKLVLTGGGALWNGLGDLIAQEAGIPLTSDFKAFNLKAEQLHLLSNAIGLAMRGVVY